MVEGAASAVGEAAVAADGGGAADAVNVQRVQGGSNRARARFTMRMDQMKMTKENTLMPQEDTMVP